MIHNILNLRFAALHANVRCAMLNSKPVSFEFKYNNFNLLNKSITENTTQNSIQKFYSELNRLKLLDYGLRVAKYNFLSTAIIL